MRTRIAFLLCVLLTAFQSHAQDNFSGFNYQAVVRDAQGQPLPNQAVGVQFTISCGIAAPYVETHATTSDDQGLIALVIGEGTPGGGIPSFSAIDWSGCGVLPMSLTVAMDISGGTNYVTVGSQDLKAVPFAMRSLTSDSGPASGWVLNGDDLHNTNSGHVGIGTASPSATLDVEGTFQLKDGTQTDKRILTSDADGNASWQQLSAAAIFGSGNVPAPDHCLNLVANIDAGASESPRSVAVSGQYAYVVTNFGGNMKVFDISAPNDGDLPIATIGAGNQPNSIAISGQYAYVTNLLEMKVFDISTPSAPASVATIAKGLGSSSIAVAGQYAYVVNHDSSSMKVFDISAPSNGDLPIAKIATGNYPTSVAVSGQYACVVHESSNNMMVFDISAPSNGDLPIATIATGDHPLAVAISGQHAYVANSNDQNMMIFDISAPSDGDLPIATVATGINPASIAVSGQFAYVVNFNSGNMMVFDISSPNDGDLPIATIGVGSFPRSIAVSGRYANVVRGNGPLLVLDLFCSTAVTIDPVSGAFSTQSLDETDPHVGVNNLDKVPKWDGSALVSGSITDVGGKIGIGTTAPKFNVHVGAGSGLSTGFGNGIAITSVIPRIYFEETDAPVGMRLMDIHRDNNGLTIGSLSDDGSSWTNANILFAGSNGHVGIGTSTPRSLLDVSTGTNTTGYKILAGANEISILERFNGVDFASRIWAAWPGVGKLRLGVNAYGGDPSTVAPTLTIHNGQGVGVPGYVGIGTDSPTARLEVDGFTKLGTDAPAIKTKLFTGTTTSSHLIPTSIPHGLGSRSKVISVTVLIDRSSLLEPYSDFDVGDTSLFLHFSSGSTFLSRPYKVLVTYVE